MWNLWTKATKYSKLPSEVFDPRGELGALTRWQLDNAVTAFGIVMENALQEMIEEGSGASKKWRAKYKLAQLLDDKFTFTNGNGGDPQGVADHLAPLKGAENADYDEVSA